MKNEPDNLSEARLTTALAKLPQAPVPSNFTARVLAAVDAEENRAARNGWRWPALFPRIAVATAVLVFAGVSIQRYEVYSQRAALAKNVARVVVTQPLPSADALENLDAIQRLSQSGHAEVELRAVLQ